MLDLAISFHSDSFAAVEAIILCLCHLAVGANATCTAALERAKDSDALRHGIVAVKGRESIPTEGWDALAKIFKILM